VLIFKVVTNCGISLTPSKIVKEQGESYDKDLQMTRRNYSKKQFEIRNVHWIVKEK
jgi:hypothetical protein